MRAPVLADASGHWAEGDIAWAVRKGFVTGLPDGTFRPHELCSWAELMVLLLRSVGEREDAHAMERLGTRLPKVPVEYWARGYLELAYSRGLLLTDYGEEGWYGAAVTRAEVARVAWKLLGSFGLSDSIAREPVQFRDIRAIPPEASRAVASLAALGVVRGDESGRFRPHDPVTRAEAVVICARLLGVLGRRWDVEGEVLAWDKEKRAIKMNVGGEPVTLTYRSGMLSVYDERGPVASGAVPAGVVVGVVLEEGVFPLVSYVRVISR